MTKDKIKVRRNKNNGGYCADFYIGDKKYWADITYAMFVGPECMIFEYNKDGSIDYNGVYLNNSIQVNEESLLECINEFIKDNRND